MAAAQPNPQNMPLSTQTSTSRLFQEKNMTTTGPPPLPYDLRDHKRTLIIAFTIMLVFDGLMQTLVFYPLYLKTTLSIKIIFAIICIPTTWSFLDWGKRTWRLLQKSDEYRPLNSGRWTWDFYHISYTSAFPFITLFFALGSALGNITLVSLPLPFLLTLVGTQLLLGSASYTFAPNRPTPFRFSSLPAGSRPRPPVYTIVEDIVAVNGGGGKAYRVAIDRRYEASPVFRRVLGRMSWAWGAGGTVLGGTLIVLVGVGSREGMETLRLVAYGLCWLLPWACTAVGVVATIKWVQRRLREEEETWPSVGVGERV